MDDWRDEESRAQAALAGTLAHARMEERLKAEEARDRLLMWDRILIAITVGVLACVSTSVWYESSYECTLPKCKAIRSAE